MLEYKHSTEVGYRQTAMLPADKGTEEGGWGKALPKTLMIYDIHDLTPTNNSISIQFICIAQFHKLQICLGVLYNLYT